MKTMLLLNILFATLISCSSANYETTATHDKKLVGTWHGSVVQNEIIVKQWDITRKADGTFSMTSFPGITERRRPVTFTGKWWTKKGFYYQKATDDTEAVKYKYSGVSSKEVQFNDPINKGAQKFSEIRK